MGWVAASAAVATVTCEDPERRSDPPAAGGPVVDAPQAAEANASATDVAATSA